MPGMDDKALTGEIICIDKFGNAISNISRTDIEALISLCPEASIRIFLKQREVRMKECYAEAGDESLSAIINSSDPLEFFVNCGNASLTHHISIGEVFEIKMTP